MARGWESKSVEAQIESAEDRAKAAIERQVSLEQLAERAKRESIEMDRRRILNEIQAARHPRHRQMLEDALAHLNARIAELN